MLPKMVIFWGGRNLLKGFLFMALSFFLVVSALPAMGQGVAPDLDSMMGATADNDWSMSLWRMLLGEFADNPFGALGAPTSLLGAIFLVFNGAMFALGFIWALYGIVGAVVQTAHEGEVLGKRMSTVWFPIRMIVGVAGMVPVFGGFTLSQAVMMQLTIVGIGIGNAMWSEGLDRAANFTGLTSSQAFSPAIPSQIRSVAKTMFLGNLCVIAERESQLASQAIGVAPLPTSEVPGVIGSESLKNYKWQYGTPSQPDKCASVVVNYGPGRSADGSLVAFRTASVDYDAITASSNRAYRDYGNLLHEAMGGLAENWYGARNQAIASGLPMPVLSDVNIEEQVSLFLASVGRDVGKASSESGSAISDQALENMRGPGWFGAGAWFSTFAEINAGIADAGKQTTATSSFPCGSQGGARCEIKTSHTLEILSDASTVFALMDRQKGTDSDGDSSRAILDSMIKDTGCWGWANSLGGTATGNCSLGQGIVSAALRGTALGSGGGGGGDWMRLDNTGLVNPVIALKNVGDYVMSFSTTVLIGAGVATVASNTVGKIAGAVGRSSIPGLSHAGEFISSGSESVKAIGSWVTSMAIILLVLGAMMSIYLPLLPFITWMGSIVSYAASMIEGMAGMPLHSMAHMESDGEGMGQRTAHGYLFYINALARPALMIIGFFVASTLVIVIGTIQIKLFLPAMANAQGNSVTGIASIAMFLVVYTVLCWTLIQSCFNLIHVITDQVLSFVGGQIASKLGQDTEDKANNMFLLAARTGPGMVGSFGKGTSNVIPQRGRFKAKPT